MYICIYIGIRTCTSTSIYISLLPFLPLKGYNNGEGDNTNGRWLNSANLNMRNMQFTNRQDEF